MPKTTAEHRNSLTSPAMCELFPVRDFLDNVMVRLDGSYAAGFRIQGSLTYFADDGTRNETKTLLESLLRTVPEESMRIQFRYEVVETTNGMLDKYAEFRRTDHLTTLLLDEDRETFWRERERKGGFLTRIAAVYFIWNPEKHRRATESGAPKLRQGKKKHPFQFTLSPKKAIERTQKEHEETLAQFESMLIGIETSLMNVGLQPERMTHDALFVEIKRALSPLGPDSLPLKDHLLSARYVSAREQLARVSILDERESYLNIANNLP